MFHCLRMYATGYGYLSNFVEKFDTSRQFRAVVGVFVFIDGICFRVFLVAKRSFVRPTLVLIVYIKPDC